MPPIRVVIVDDHEIVRSGLCSLLASELDIHVVGTANTGEDGLDVIEILRPDIAVIDYSLPRMSGLEVCDEVSTRHPKTAVVMLTAYNHDELVLKAVEAGAKAYVYKDIDAAELERESAP